jgi:hypothetical protein
LSLLVLLRITLSPSRSANVGEWIDVQKNEEIKTSISKLTLEKHHAAGVGGVVTK